MHTLAKGTWFTFVQSTISIIYSYSSWIFPDTPINYLQKIGHKYPLAVPPKDNSSVQTEFSVISHLESMRYNTSKLPGCAQTHLCTLRSWSSAKLHGIYTYRCMRYGLKFNRGSHSIDSNTLHNACPHHFVPGLNNLHMHFDSIKVYLWGRFHNSPIPKCG